MKTVYQFGYKIEDNSLTWSEKISNLFDIDLSDVEIVNIYNKEKNWFETYSKSNKFNYPICFCDHKLEKIKFGFNRYQEFVYITLVFDGMVEDMVPIKMYIEDNIGIFVDTFKIPFKEPDIYEDYNDIEKYKETLVLGNPVYINITDDFEFSKINNKIKYTTYKESEEVDFDIKYCIEYVDNGMANYERVFQNNYIVKSYEDKDESFDKAIEHFHSIFVLFNRSESHYNELTGIDKPSELMAVISNKLNVIWPKERINLFLINRFLNASLYNRTFYSVLELNAQMNSIFSQTRVKYQKIEDKYEKQYERVLHNFKHEDIEEISYYRDLLKYLRTPSSHRARLLDRINDFFEPTDAQIDRLRSDNDSKVNFAIQWVMSILSVVIFLWGISTFWYQSIVNVSNPITDTVLGKLPWAPSYLLLLTGITLITIFVFVSYFLIYNASLASSEMKAVIATKKLDIITLSDKIKTINKYTESYDKKHHKKCNKKKLLSVTETFKLLTTHIILNIDNLGDIDEFTKLIKEIKE